MRRLLSYVLELRVHNLKEQRRSYLWWIARGTLKSSVPFWAVTFSLLELHINLEEPCLHLQGPSVSCESKYQVKLFCVLQDFFFSTLKIKQYTCISTTRSTGRNGGISQKVTVTAMRKSGLTHGSMILWPKIMAQAFRVHFITSGTFILRQIYFYVFLSFSRRNAEISWKEHDLIFLHPS